MIKEKAKVKTMIKERDCTGKNDDKRGRRGKSDDTREREEVKTMIKH